jgi:arabinogalactan oligomer/maltooligosaccharide transport system permease protein
MSTATLGRRTPTPEPVREPAPPGRLRRSWDKHWYAWAMVTPVVIVLGVLVFYPLARGIYLSFTDLTEANQQRELCTPSITGELSCQANPKGWRFVGLDNYIDVLSGQVGQFWPQFLTTIIWTVTCVVFTFAIGMGLAVLLNRPMRGRSIYRVLLILPWAVPGFVSAFSWRFMFNQDFGVVNGLLKAVGMQPVAWFDSQASALSTAIITNIWLGVPFMIVSLLGGLTAIPAELYEAATIDGATPWQRFRNVTLPGLRPVSMTVLLLSTIWTFNMFPVIFLVTRGQPAGQTEILVTGAYRAAFEGIRNYSLASTYGVLILSILLVFSVFYRRALRKQGEVW